MPVGGADPNGLSVGRARRLLLHFSASARQRMFEPSEDSGQEVAGSGWCYNCLAGARVGHGSRGACSSGLAALVPPGCDHGGLLVVLLNCSSASGGSAAQTRQGRWRSNDFMRPVLKHGPRSLTCMRVLE